MNFALCTYNTAWAFAERNIPSAWLHGWTGNVRHIGEAMRKDWALDFAAWADNGGWLDGELVDAAFDRWVEQQGGYHTNDPIPSRKFA